MRHAGHCAWAGCQKQQAMRGMLIILYLGQSSTMRTDYTSEGVPSPGIMYASPPLAPTATCAVQPSVVQCTGAVSEVRQPAAPASLAFLAEAEMSQSGAQVLAGALIIEAVALVVV